MTITKEMLRAFQRLDEARSEVAEEDKRTDTLFCDGICCNARNFMWWPEWDGDFASEHQKAQRDFNEKLEKMKAVFSTAKDLVPHPEDFNSGFFLWVQEKEDMSPEEQYDYYQLERADPAFIKAFSKLREEFLQFCIEYLTKEAEDETI